MFVWVFLSNLRIFHKYGEATFTSCEGLQILTYMYTLHSWPLSSEGSLAFATRSVTQDIHL